MATLRDHLSRLTLRQAVKLLGPGGDTLLRSGGRRAMELDEQVRLADDELVVGRKGGDAWQQSQRLTRAEARISRTETSANP